MVSICSCQNALQRKDFTGRLSKAQKGEEIHPFQCLYPVLLSTFALEYCSLVVTSPSSCGGNPLSYLHENIIG